MYRILKVLIYDNFNRFFDEKIRNSGEIIRKIEPLAVHLKRQKKMEKS